MKSPSVLLLHGQLLDGGIYDSLAARLAGTRRVLVPDLPGYGASPLLAPHTLDAVRAALVEELLARGVRELDVVGYSLGAYHALALALEGRLAVGRLYLLGAVAGIDAPVRAAFAEYARAAAGGLDFGEAFAAGAFPAEWASAHPDDVERVKSAIRAVPRESLAADLESVVRMPDLRPRLGEVRAETLLRSGTLDRNTPLAWSEEIARAVPRGRVEVAEGIGHVYLTQDERATIESVVAFLAT